MKNPWPERDDSEEWEDIKRENLDGVGQRVLKALGFKPIKTAGDKSFDDVVRAILADGGWPVLVASPKTMLETGRLPLEMYEFRPEGWKYAIPLVPKEDAPDGEFIVMDARKMSLSAVQRAVVEKAREEARTLPAPSDAASAAP